jgi:hypothetical protein
MMKPYRLIAVLAAALLALVAAGCGASVETTTSATSATTVPQTGVTADEYAVYSALIQSAYVDATQPKQIVIHDTTADPRLYSPRSVAGAMKSSWPDLGDDVLSEFETKNQTSSALARRFALSVPYTLISGQELAANFPPTAPGWENFYSKYPGSQGRVVLSRVGFNQAKDTAVLYAEFASGATAGEGDVVLMKKTDGRWTVQGRGMIRQA